MNVLKADGDLFYKADMEVPSEFFLQNVLQEAITRYPLEDESWKLLRQHVWRIQDLYFFTARQ